jgi:hypothetical protein
VSSGEHKVNHFEKFLGAMKQCAISMSDESIPQDFLLDSCGNLSVYYAPFDYINHHAKITICGITPGFQQAVLALNEAKKQFLKGIAIDEVMRKAKETASFGGAMRKNLISMLDCIGAHRKLGLLSCEQLFTSHTHLVHYTSALRYPVFVSGENYSGTPDIISNKFLLAQVETYLAEELKSLPENCLYIPLGPKVTKAFLHLSSKGIVKSSQVLDGMPHPSGANAERIKYFLGEKKKEDLSKKTNSSQIDESKAKLREKLEKWHA